MFPSSITLRDFYANRVLPLKVQGEGEMINLRMTLGSTTILNQIRFDPSLLFTGGEQGILIDPSDLSTLFTDVAGTTPVTAPGQTVALALDKSKGLVLGPELVTNGTFDANINGWTTVFSTLVWSAGRARITTTPNLNSQSIYQAVSVEAGKSYRISASIQVVATDTNVNVSIRGGTSPDLSSLAVVIGATTSGFASGSIVYQAVSTGLIYIHVRNFGNNAANSEFFADNISVRELPGNHLTQSVAAARPIYGRHPARGYVNQLVNSDTVTTQNVTVAGVAMTLSFTGTGTVTLSGASTAGPLVGTGANNRVSLAFTPSAGTLTLTVSGDVRLGQLERGTLTAYQRTGAGNGLAFPRPVSYDITEAGQPSLHYLFCDGLARWMVSPTITPGTDKVQVFTGVRKLSDAAGGILIEHGPITNSTNGTFGLFAPSAARADYNMSSRGTVLVPNAYINPAVAAPDTSVVSGIAEIGTDTNILRVDGAQVSTLATDQGTGNYTAQQLYIGSRAGTGAFLNGLIYSIVVRFGPNLPTATIEQVERWTAQRTGVTLP